LLFSNRSILCFVFERDNKFIVFLSLENGYEMLDLKTFQKTIIFKFIVTENIVIYFKNVIKIHEKILIVMLENEVLVFDNRSLKIVNRFKVNIDVSFEILNYVSVLMNGHFIIVSSNKGKIFVFNFINNRLFIKYDFREMILLISDNEKFFYLNKDLCLKMISLSLISNADNDNYYDEKMLYLLYIFELEIDVEKENEKRENFIKKFSRKTNKFILNRSEHDF
jgi:WD40 repeat protein